MSGNRIEANILDALQARLGHFFRDSSLLIQALTHPSAAAEQGLPRTLSYERLEFLGDALISAYLAEMLFNLYPSESEGVLTRLRAYWASQSALAERAQTLRLQECVCLGRGETRDGGAGKERILASVLEALFGALYLDAGHRAARKFAATTWRDAVRRRGLDILLEDAKTRLQEMRQAGRRSLPVYRSTGKDGRFSTVVLLDDVPAGRGEGGSRKASEQAAARNAIEKLGASELGFEEKTGPPEGPL